MIRVLIQKFIMAIVSKLFTFLGNVQNGVTLALIKKNKFESQFYSRFSERHGCHSYDTSACDGVVCSTRHF